MGWRFSVLVVANVTADSDELLEAMQERAARGPTSFTLLAPAATGGKAAREAAERRLDAAIERMRSAGLEVEGRTGVPDPVAAVHELWDPAVFDEVIVSTLPTGTSKWLQCDLPHRVERLTGAPVTHVVAATPEEPPAGSPPPEHRDYGVVGALGVLWSPPHEPADRESPTPEPVGS
jgi:hypothetical protein